LCVVSAVAGSACGRKGPPLAPLVRLPGPVVDLAARRLGDEVVLQFTIPAVNVDASRPADLDRVEVYAHTGPLPTPADFLKYGSLIGNIAVKAPGPVGSRELPGLDEGAKASVSEKLTPAELQIGKMPPVRTQSARRKTAVVAPVYETPETVNAVLPLTRYYVTVGVSRKNQRGPFSPALPVPLYPPLPAPGAIEVRYTQDELSLAWTPLPRDEDIFVPAAVYNVYEVADTIAPDVAGGTGVAVVSSAASPAPVTPAAAPAAAAMSSAVAASVPAAAATTSAAAAPAPANANVQGAKASAPGVAGGSSPAPAAAAPAPPGAKAPAPLLKPALNPAPLAAPAFKQQQVDFGARRCYVVRATRMAGTVSIESQPSLPVCLTAVDTFPPAAPRGLAAVPGEGAVNLIWEPNTEKDLAGYLVFRGETGAEKLVRITPAPIRDTTYRDTTVKSGTSYDYVVVAVDDAPAPNISEYSNRQTAVVP
jgi:hypothetical protein